MLTRCAGFILLAATVCAQPSQPDRFAPVVNRLLKAINAGDSAALEREFNQQMSAALPEEKLKPVLASIRTQFGNLQTLDAPHFDGNEMAVYPAHFERGLLDMKIVLDGEGKIGGLWFGPHANTNIPVREKHETELALPFKGTWLTFWGGDTRELNQHHDVPAQRFAFDFVGVGPDGKTRKGQGSGNEDYYAFGRELLAPADGVVTEIVEGVRDNVPGSMNPYVLVGNAVFIEHRSGEVSLLAHLKQGSIRVKAGDRVRKGQVIGLCGNSGNTTKPHLHYQLQNTPLIQDATGIKVQFHNVVLHHGTESFLKPEYSPVKDDVISDK